MTNFTYDEFNDYEKKFLSSKPDVSSLDNEIFSLLCIPESEMGNVKIVDGCGDRILLHYEK